MTMIWDNGSPVPCTTGAAGGPAIGADTDLLPRRRLMRAMVRGARGLCPACGGGRMFTRYLKVADTCAHCDEPLHHQRADDAPPYFSTFIVGHVVVALVLWLEMAVFIPMTLALALVSLPPIKGALVGQQWALFMHGFGPEALARLAEATPAGFDPSIDGTDGPR